ncbi:hypothetical protein ZWY2020_009417 [Hordeum vulgare]|nr:hypothetical protein ZWY2020_009417 [Hordeum vulgare]
MPSPAWAFPPSGFQRLQIVGYSGTKDLPGAAGTALESRPFMVGGYRWSIMVYPNGKLPEDAGYMTVAFALVQDVEHPVKVHAGFSIIYEVEKQDPSHVRTIEITHVPANFSMGFARYIAREALEKSEHLQNDCFTIRCDLIVVGEGRQGPEVNTRVH